MSVFKEKNGSCEGANLLSEKARFQVSPGRFDIGRGLSLDFQCLIAAHPGSAGGRSTRRIATACASVFQERR
jgi:hypothetical protein